MIMSNWKSSTLTIYDSPDHCLICRFIDGDRSEEAMMATIKQLDTTLHDKEELFRVMVDWKISQATMEYLRKTGSADDVKDPEVN